MLKNTYLNNLCKIHPYNITIFLGDIIVYLVNILCSYYLRFPSGYALYV